MAYIQDFHLSPSHMNKTIIKYFIKINNKHLTVKFDKYRKNMLKFKL